MRKIKNVWVDRHTIETIAARHDQVQAILCHGTRNATEQRYFLESFPQAKITGTEISPTADQFPMTVQWDFHEVNADWTGRMDIVYSNAIDHSYDPVLALRVWATGTGGTVIASLLQASSRNVRTCPLFNVEPAS